MSLYHRLYVPRALWEELEKEASLHIGLKTSAHAINKLRNYDNPFKTPHKTGVAPKEEIKKTSSRKGKKFLFHDNSLGLTNWVYRSDDEKLYDTYFYFCEKRNMLTDEGYGPLFRTDRYTDFSSDQAELAKCLIVERDNYLKKLNVPRETTPEKDFTEYDEAVAERKEKMDELQEGKEDT